MCAQCCGEERRRARDSTTERQASCTGRRDDEEDEKDEDDEEEIGKNGKETAQIGGPSQRGASLEDQLPFALWLQEGMMTYRLRVAVAKDGLRVQWACDHRALGHRRT